MRDTKFRAWDRLCKRYWYGSFNISWDGKVQNLASVIQEARIKAGWTLELSYTDVCQFDLEQFTGLKDKNGKEMYEGDIIEFSYEYGFIGALQNCTVKNVITFQMGQYWVGTFSLSRAIHESCKVINNIHKNPELLKD